MSITRGNDPLRRLRTVDPKLLLKLQSLLVVNHCLELVLPHALSRGLLLKNLHQLHV